LTVNLVCCCCCCWWWCYVEEHLVDRRCFVKYCLLLK